MQTQTIELNGTWQFKEYPESARRMRDLDEQNWLNCSVPSSIYTCLIDAGQINISDLNSNPEDFLWPGERSWIFQKFFDADSELLKLDRIELVLDGLDTFCQIWLNDKLIAKTDNMFCSHRFDIKNELKQKDNRLLVKCSSVTENGDRLMSRFGRLNYDPCSLPCRTYVRKAQCQFGWDWAPPLPGCGVWQSVRIEGFKNACIRDIQIRTIEADPITADIKVSVQVEKFTTSSAISCNLAIADQTGKTVAQTKLEFNDENKNISTVLKIKSPKLWFPASYGPQPLYSLKAELISGDQAVNTVSKKFGIRTVRLNQTPDEFGTSFEFIINNQPVYVRGAAWIPASIFIGSTTTAEYEKLLNAAKDANINMLRVWGGGIYETETFYNICDRLGIMVWQDFPFACAYYPDRSWFYEMIKSEASQNITRLRNHPSLVIWCGNNEIDWLHAIDGIGKGKKFYGKDIYHKILPDIVGELDPDRDYINSTPLGPAKNPNQPTTGTVHQWNIWSGLEPTDNYLTLPEQTPRFVAEFGFQSLPDKKTILEFLPEKELHPASKELEKHNYQPNGSARLHYYINENFRPPTSLDEFIYLSQITQARAIRKNIEHLRCNSNINGGALFWQFNDCCPSMSWSCVDYKVRPKALYYYTKRFFAPVIMAVTAKYDQGHAPAAKEIISLSSSMINHSTEPITGLLTCRLVDMDLKTIDEFKRPVSVSPAGLASVSLPQSFLKPARPQNCFVHVMLENNQNVKISENSFFYLPDKYINWPGQKIDIQAERIDKLNWLIKLRASTAAKDVFINLPFDVELSDNFFDMLTCETKTITARTKDVIDDLPEKISLTSVNSIFPS